jgi:hypothetical protein
MQILKLSLDSEMRMPIWFFSELFDQLIHLFDFFLILFLLKQESMLFQQKQVNSIQPLEVVVGSIHELIAVVHQSLFYSIKK